MSITQARREINIAQARLERAVEQHDYWSRLMSSTADAITQLRQEAEASTTPRRASELELMITKKAALCADLRALMQRSNARRELWAGQLLVDSRLRQL